MRDNISQNQWWMTLNLTSLKLNKDKTVMLKLQLKHNILLQSRVSKACHCRKYLGANRNSWNIIT